ncbi:MAG TPA: hypothetical protein PK185_04945 [Cyclobacteriaceae bacterium]|jgi:hypothetical protein|nr:hypothetical protein [Cyclobacteriaceae bacterium]
MRVIGNIVHEKCNITFFHWNNRYLIKLEAGPFEQTFKIQEYDLASEEELKEIITEEFINQSLARFEDMANSLGQAIEKI